MRDKSRKTRHIKLRFGERLSREEGTIIKDWGGRLPFALIYPNDYYLGMSNLGIHAIYSLLNSYPEVVCERIFWDKENREKNLPPLSVESQRPLTDFAVLAFSISYELDYFHVARILKSSGIPLYAADRDERHPLIIAGGTCITANPMPLSPFFDCLCIGEAEPIFPTMLPVLSESISDRRDKLLKTLALLPGIFVPAYPPGNPVLRQWAKDLDSFATTSIVLTPDTELGDLYLIEAERGCQRGCRFCLVNTTFSPMRFRSVENLTEQARYGLRQRKRIGLIGPAVADHPHIKELLDNLHGLGAELSVSSLRMSSLSQEMLSALTEGKAQTVTMAPEAGSQRLRQVIKKGLSDSDILEAMERVAQHPIKQLKLYFMLGLPSETDEDAEDIAKLTLAAKEILDRQKSSTRITINIAPFVPKAGTPFQWLPMAPLQALNHRMSLLKNTLSPKGIKVKVESPAWSLVQGVLSRGGQEIAEVLANIDEISLSGWRKTVEKYHLDIDYYVNQTWDTNGRLPWDMIDLGVKPEFLKVELGKSSVPLIR
ncbi:radical SAM protein [Chloroflexota bacterium]